MTKRAGEVLETLISSQGNALVRFLSRKLGSIDDAQEIAQDAFMRLYRLEHADDLDNARAYLFQVASNMAIDQLRRRKLHARTSRTRRCASATRASTTIRARRRSWSRRASSSGWSTAPSRNCPCAAARR